MAIDDVYDALAKGHVQVAIGNSTDGRISKNGFTVLVDDRHYFPPYDAAVVVRMDVLAHVPQLEPTLRQLSGRIHAEDIQRTNAAIDIDHKDRSEAARALLQLVLGRD